MSGNNTVISQGTARVLLFATRNAGKVRELRQLFADLPNLEIRTLDEVPPLPEVIEDAATFEGNARKKAWETAIGSGLMALSDDSGLEVDALDGRPGVHSARYSGDLTGGHVTDASNNKKLIADLTGIPLEQRTARYRVVLAFADPKGPLGTELHVEHGVCEGRIRTEPAGEGGFGYDPYFEVAGYACTMAELPAAEKNRISHRALASRKMHEFLRRYLG